MPARLLRHYLRHILPSAAASCLFSLDFIACMSCSFILLLPSPFCLLIVTPCHIRAHTLSIYFHYLFSLYFFHIIHILIFDTFLQGFFFFFIWIDCFIDAIAVIAALCYWYAVFAIPRYADYFQAYCFFSPLLIFSLQFFLDVTLVITPLMPPPYWRFTLSHAIDTFSFISRHTLSYARYRSYRNVFFFRHHAPHGSQGSSVLYVYSSSPNQLFFDIMIYDSFCFIACWYICYVDIRFSSLVSLLILALLSAALHSSD